MPLRRREPAFVASVSVERPLPEPVKLFVAAFDGGGLPQYEDKT